MADLDLYDLKARLGGTLSDGGRRWSGPGPGHSKRDTSLSVRLTDDGRALVHSFAGDSFEACAAHIGLTRPERWPGLPPAKRLRRRFAKPLDGPEGAQDREAFVTAIWSGREPLPESPADAYLSARGLTLPYPPADLAFHAAAPMAYRGEPVSPALIAIVRDGKLAPCGLHVTALTPDGGRGERRMFGSVAGAAVRLAQIGEDGVLAVAEGIETALSFTALFGFPCWAALSAPGLAAFTPPASVHRLIVAADGDKACRDAAQKLARRVTDLCDVDLASAPEGRDWNDVLREAGQ